MEIPWIPQTNTHRSLQDGTYSPDHRVVDLAGFDAAAIDAIGIEGSRGLEKDIKEQSLISYVHPSFH